MWGVHERGLSSAAVAAVHSELAGPRKDPDLLDTT